MQRLLFQRSDSTSTGIQHSSAELGYVKLSDQTRKWIAHDLLGNIELHVSVIINTSIYNKSDLPMVLYLERRRMERQMVHGRHNAVTIMFIRDGLCACMDESKINRHYHLDLLGIDYGVKGVH